MRLPLPLFLAVLAFAIPSLAAEPMNVELLVTDGANAVDLASCPVKVGVPLANGAFEDTSRFRLVDAAGKDVPAQFDVLARYWPASRSIRGILVSFNVRIAKGGVTKYYLHDDAKGNPAACLKIHESADAITVVTGPLRFVVNKQAFNVLDKVWFDANGDGQFANDELMLDGGAQSGAVLDGTDFGSSKKDVRFTWDYRGPIYACLKVEAATEAAPNGWGFVCRMHMFKDQPAVLVDYTLKNSAYGATGHHLDFKSFSLVHGLKNLGDSTVRLGGALADNSGAVEARLDHEVRLVADKWKHYSVDRQAQAPGLALGYVDVSDGRKGMLTAVRKISYLWPCGIKAAADRTVTVELWPAGEHQLVDQARRSHQVVYCFHPGDWDAARVAAEAKVFELWPVAFLRPSWYSKTRAFFDFGGIIAPTDELDPKVGPRRQDYPADKDGNETGWWNWGGADWRRVSSTTGGMPDDLTGVMASGRPSAMYRGDDIARHHSEMRPMWCDNYQYPRDVVLNFNATYPPNVGLRPPKAKREGSTTNWTSWDDMHPWVYEVGDYYWYTGEKFAVDYLVMHADYLLNLDHFPAIGAPGKQPCWNRETAEPMHIIMDAYKITGEKRFWDYINAFAENLIATKGNDYGVANNCGFQHGLISAAVCELYCLLPERTPEEKALKERIFQFVIGTGNGQFYWGGTPETPGSTDTWGWLYYWEAAKDKYKRGEKGSMTVQCLNELGFAYLLTGQECYKHEIGLVHGTYRKDKPGQVGKGLEGYGRVARAAWHYPQLKQAAPPPAVNDLQVEKSFARCAMLSWTSTGGNQIRVFHADKPIVEKREKFIAGLELPITSTDPEVRDIYDAPVSWTEVAPAPVGQKQTLLVGPLPESLVGQTVHFAIQALNVVSPADIGRSVPSNSASGKLLGDAPAGDQAKLLAAAAAARALTPGILEVSCQSPSLLYAALNRPAKSDAAAKVRVTRTSDGKSLAVSKVEMEINSGRLLAVHTEGLEQGVDYTVSIEGLGDGGFKATFRAQIGPDRWSPVRKVAFGFTTIGDYQGLRFWDGDFGLNYPIWQGCSSEGKIDPAKPVEENIKKVHTRLEKAKFGDLHLKMRVNPFVTQYRLVALAGDQNWPPTGGVSMIANGKEIWKQVDCRGRKFALADEKLTIEDGLLDIVFSWLNYIELYADYKWQAIGEK